MAPVARGHAMIGATSSGSGAATSERSVPPGARASSGARPASTSGVTAGLPSNHHQEAGMPHKTFHSPHRPRRTTYRFHRRCLCRTCTCRSDTARRDDNMPFRRMGRAGIRPRRCRCSPGRRRRLRRGARDRRCSRRRPCRRCTCTRCTRRPADTNRPIRASNRRARRLARGGRRRSRTRCDHSYMRARSPPRCARQSSSLHIISWGRAPPVRRFGRRALPFDTSLNVSTRADQEVGTSTRTHHRRLHASRVTRRSGCLASEHAVTVTIQARM